jgi:U3 small nucleolar RNA-associated protein 24
MGKTKRTKAFGAAKRLLGPKDERLQAKKREAAEKRKAQKEEHPGDIQRVKVAGEVTSAMFFKFNDRLGPPYHILVDTNFINFSIQNKIEILGGMMDCLFAKCTPYITDCVMAEIEKLGPKFRVALRIAKDPRFERLPCTHKGTYADDCLVDRITQHKCYIVATCDKDLRRRIRKVPGVPVMYVKQRQYTVERMPEAFGAAKD